MSKVRQNDPTDGASRQAKYREEQRKLGRKGRLIYLTDEEKKSVDALIVKLRKT